MLGPPGCAPARPGCSPRPGSPRCTAAAGRRRPAAGPAPARPAPRRAAGRAAASCRVVLDDPPHLRRVLGQVPNYSRPRRPGPGTKGPVVQAQRAVLTCCRVAATAGCAGGPARWLVIRERHQRYLHVSARPEPPLDGMTGTAGGLGQALAPGDLGPSVLVVEDDPGIATQLVRGLTRGGYQVDHVHDRRRGAEPGRAGRGPARPGAARHRRRGGLPPAAAAVGTRRSSWSRRAARRPTGSSRWTRAPTTTWSSRSGWPSCRPGSGPCCAGSGPAASVIRHGPLTVDLRTRKVTVAGRGGRADPEGVRHPGVPGRRPGPGA